MFPLNGTNKWSNEAGNRAWREMPNSIHWLSESLTDAFPPSCSHPSKPPMKMQKTYMARKGEGVNRMISLSLSPHKTMCPWNGTNEQSNEAANRAQWETTYLIHWLSELLTDARDWVRRYAPSCSHPQKPVWKYGMKKSKDRTARPSLFLVIDNVSSEQNKRAK